MANSILVNSEGKQDHMFPAKLAKLAKLALVASAKGEKKFTDPDSNNSFDVSTIQIPNKVTGKIDTVKGFTVSSKGAIWQCWSAGTTKNNKEYFKFNLFNPHIQPVDRYNNPTGMPMQLGTGVIFHNKDKSGETFTMKMHDTAATAQMKFARNLLNANVSINTVIDASDGIMKSDLDDTTQRRTRSSDVNLGY